MKIKSGQIYCDHAGNFFLILAIGDWFMWIQTGHEYKMAEVDVYAKFIYSNLVYVGEL